MASSSSKRCQIISSARPKLCRYHRCELRYHWSTSSLKYHLQAKRTADAEIATPSCQKQTTLSSLQQRCLDNPTYTVIICKIIFLTCERMLHSLPEWCCPRGRQPAEIALDVLCPSLHLLELFFAVKTQITETFFDAGLVAALLEGLLLVTLATICYDA